jgi:hypothetical protein
MKKIIAVFALVMFTVTATVSSAPNTDAKKETTPTASKHKDCKACCCDMKTGNGTKKSDSKKMGSTRDETKKEPEKK